MKLILEEHKEILHDMIGQTIEYSLIPNLSISNCETYPDDELYNVNYGHFYLSELINLRLENEKSWIKFSPGPDEAIEPWSPFWVKKLKSPDFASIVKDNRWFKEEYRDKLKNNKFENFELENHFLDNYLHGLGLNRCNFWTGIGKITKIEIFGFNPYAACIISHENDFSWNIYAEYDFNFWINFSHKMTNGIRKTSESSIVIK